MALKKLINPYGVFDNDLNTKLRVRFDDKVYYEKIISKYVSVKYYATEAHDELDMAKGDFFIPLEPISYSRENYGWILVQNLVNKEIGMSFFQFNNAFKIVIYFIFIKVMYRFQICYTLMIILKGLGK